MELFLFEVSLVPLHRAQKSMLDKI
jgi:hypothetical protein